MTVHSLSAHAVKLAGGSTRRRVLALFEKHRARPGAPYEERHFMEFLLPERMGRQTVTGGFQASRRLNAFMNDVQYEFAICFSARERHANHTLQGFVERVVELGRSRDQTPWRWNDQLTAGLEWAVTVLANLVLLTMAVTLADHPFALGFLGCAAILVNGWFAGCAWKAREYCRRLHSRIAVSGKKRPPLSARQWRPPYEPMTCLSRLRRHRCASSPGNRGWRASEPVKALGHDAQ